jgi:hypothetical protein|tara:strand:+ start:164 stop:310 length:147 start_codon:yes stop_codon:yes gene_type:complete
MNRPNRVPRETVKSFSERKIPRDEQLEKAKQENQRIREKMRKLTNKED